MGPARARARRRRRPGAAGAAGAVAVATTTSFRGGSAACGMETPLGFSSHLSGCLSPVHALSLSLFGACCCSSPHSIHPRTQVHTHLPPPPFTFVLPTAAPLQQTGALQLSRLRFEHSHHAPQNYTGHTAKKATPLSFDLSIRLDRSNLCDRSFAALQAGMPSLRTHKTANNYLHTGALAHKSLHSSLDTLIHTLAQSSGIRYLHPLHTPPSPASFHSQSQTFDEVTQAHFLSPAICLPHAYSSNLHGRNPGEPTFYKMTAERLSKQLGCTAAISHMYP
jgi:hypothetical protein